MIATHDNGGAVDLKPKNFLTEAEMLSVLLAARKGRHGARDHAMMLLAYRHGLRVSELINLPVANIDLEAGRLLVQRSKGSLSTTHPMRPDEIRAVNGWMTARKGSTSPFLFFSERGPFTQLYL